MKPNHSKQHYIMLLIILFFSSMLWTETNKKLASLEADAIGVFIIKHNEIIKSGARNLEDILSRLPGIRISTNSIQSRPSAGPLVSSDSFRQLSASHFSRILMLFNGHPLNKKWHGGADHEWGTGFLEGIKEIHVYVGPAAMVKNDGMGAMDIIIDLIPFDGLDQLGTINFRLTQSLNEQRLDKSLFHISTGNRWGENGHYSIFADVTRWKGDDLKEISDFIETEGRRDRKNPSFQLGGIFKRGHFGFMARHMQHYYFDFYSLLGRKSLSTFFEANGTFNFPSKWKLKINASADYFVSKWGFASSIAGKAIDDWDEVKEFNIMLKAGLSRNFKKTSILFNVDYQNFKIDGGPENSDDNYSVMNFSTRRYRTGANLCIIRHITDNWWFKGTLRLEKAEGYSDLGVLPELSLQYRRKDTKIGLSFAMGQRYMDTWYRVGSYYGNPINSMPAIPYIVPIELKPEKNHQLRLWLDQGFGEQWKIHASVFIGKYSNLMGLDWDYAFEYQFNQLRAMNIGDYSYWGGSGSLLYHKEHMDIGANISFQGVLNSQLMERQFYVFQEGNQSLYLAPVVGNIFFEWRPYKHFYLSTRLFISSSTKNGGIDFTVPNFDFIYNIYPFNNTPAYATLDFSLRLLNLFKKFEIQLTLHNVLNHLARLPMIEGGYFFARGREISLTLRGQF